MRLGKANLWYHLCLKAKLEHSTLQVRMSQGTLQSIATCEKLGGDHALLQLEKGFRRPVDERNLVSVRPHYKHLAIPLRPT